MIILSNFVYLTMFLPKLYLMSILLHIADGFLVKGPSGPLVVPLGGSVLLPCSVDSLSSLEDLEVEWKRSDSQTLIHLYQDGDIRPEVQHEDYHDRAHFFTDDIKQGNFSLLLKNVTAEDEGQYTCTVHSGQESHETVVEIKDVERLMVSGSDQSISVYVGEDVTLNCSVDSHIPPEDIEEVSWKKTDKDEHILVLLYQNKETQLEASDEQYTDRVEFFTDEIHRGNFSLRLKRVRTEDKGVYMCQVFAGRFSDNTTVILQQLGLSGFHIMVLILCISACGSALLFCSLIYCRSNNTGLRVEGYYWVSLEDSAVLPCFINKLLPAEVKKVEWSKSGLKGPVFVYQDGNIKAKVQQEDYHDRAHFITDNFKNGNFSLLLKNVRKEDEGKYTCTVHSGWRTVSTVSVNLEYDEDDSDLKVDYSCDLVIPLGASVLLPCIIDKPLSEEDMKVEWSKSVNPSENPVCVYEDGAEIQQEDYHDRAHFINADIKHGNFSLLLKNVTNEDEGEYTCEVYSGDESVFSVTTTLVLSLLDSDDEEDYSSDLVIPLGASVLLPCIIDKPLSEEDMKVEWSKSVNQTQNPVCVYEDGAEIQQEDYHDRAHFINADNKYGNFSLLLKNVTNEDEGEYTCEVYSGDESVFSVTTKLVLRLLDSDDEEDYSCDLVIPLGASVLLPCIIDKPLSEEDMMVEWSKSVNPNPVCVYEDGAEIQQEDYHDRAHFINADIKHGNFSLLLKNVTNEDEGEYTCEVYSGDESVFSVTTTLEPRLLDTALRLQMSLVFCPNIIMFFALVFWGVSEGSVNETVLCCALYIVRPLMLLFTAPYKEQFTGKIETLLNWSLETDYISFTTVVYSVLFKSAWEKSLNFAASDRAMIIALFVIVLLLCLIYSINVLLKITVELSQRMETILDVVASITFYVLPSLQFVLVFFSFGSATGGFIIVAVLPVITSATRYDWNDTCGNDLGCSPLVRRLVWIVLMCFMNTVLIYFYITALEKENDRVGWACTIGFLQVIWTVWNCLYSFEDWEFTRITAVYVFGSVGVVVFSAVGLMTELIMKTLNGEGLVGDLRIIVFSSESLFTALVVIIVILSPWIKKDLQCCQIPAKCKKAAPTESPQNQNAADAQEMNPLVNKQETDKNREADDPPHDSQT